MKKSYKRGFVLAETIAVSAVVLTALVFIYIQFVNINNSYYTSFKYNTVDDIYKVKNIISFIEDDEIDTLISEYSNSNYQYIDITSCDIFIEYQFCEELFRQSDVKQVIFTSEDVTQLKDNLSSIDSFSEEFKTFIRRISSDKNAKYRLIVEFNSGNFATLKFDSKYAYDTRYRDNSGANIPELVDGLIPVIYENNTWKVADVTEKWYDYDRKWWANAIVLNDGITKNVGDTLDLTTDVALMFVWIPRFEYQIPTESLGITGTPKAIDINFISDKKIIATDGYNIHPGFTFDGKNKSGLWFAKFEASSTDTTCTSYVSNPSSGIMSSSSAIAACNKVHKIIIKPNVQSLRNINMVNIYTSSLNVKNNYNLNGVDTHASKYLEWTTASYLTNSIYGRCSNMDTCVEVTINNNSNYITGMAGKVISAEASTDTHTYETNGGVLASSTGNIYGIYDLSGGAAEYNMAVAKSDDIVYLAGRSAAEASGFNGTYYDGTTVTGLIKPDEKYYDIFTISIPNTAYYSDLIYVNKNNSMNGVLKELMSNENSNNQYIWYNDSFVTVTAGAPFSIMSGYYSVKEYSGIFYSQRGYGSSYVGASFRVIMTIE